MRSTGLLPRQQPGGLTQQRSRVQRCRCEAWRSVMAAARPAVGLRAGWPSAGPCRATARPAAAAPPLQALWRRQTAGGGSSGSGRLPGRCLAPAPRAGRLGLEQMKEMRDANPYIKRLNEEHGVEGFVEFYMTSSGLPAAYIFHPSGQTLEVYLQGAHVTRWLDVQGRNLLFLRPDAEFEPGKPINSGISLAFPQWREGELPSNGFADKLTWDVVDAGLGFNFMNLVDQPDFTPSGSDTILIDEETMESAIGGPFEDEEEAEEGEEALAGAADAWEEGEEGEERADDETAAAAAAPAEDEPPKKRRGRPRKTSAPQSDDDEDNFGGGFMGGRGTVAAAAVEAEEGPEGAADDEEGEVPDWMRDLTPDDLGYGIVGDVAPYVMLRLRDSEETRAMWPHPFELTCKISLMESDDFPDPKAGLPRGIHPWDGWNSSLTDTHPPRWVDYGDEEEAEEGEPEDPTAPVELVRDEQTDKVEEEEALMQVKYEFEVKHTGAEGDAPYRFQLAATPTFSTCDMLSRGSAHFIRVLGLGTKNTFDYSYDPRSPVLGAVLDDYVNFGERRTEMVVINSYDADVKFCPGDRTHYEFFLREGFRDSLVFHPGPFPTNQEEFWNRYVCFGAGRVAAPKLLKPGESFKAEYVIRRHERYWDPPMWDRSSPQPMPPWLPPSGDQDGGEEDMVVEGGEDTGFETGDADWVATS